MEIWRPAARATVITFPILDSSGFPTQNAGSLDSEFVAWSDTTQPGVTGNNFADCTNEATQVGTTGIYTLAVASTELPAASPYVMIRIQSTQATQYVLIRTASQFANVTGINGTNIATSIVAGTMPIDQGAAMVGTTAGSLGQSWLRTNYATVYLDAAVSGALTNSTALNGSTAGSVGQSLLRMNYATVYVDAAISSRSAPATAQTIDQTTALNGATAGSIGQSLLRINYATVYLDQAVSTASAGKVWDELLSTHVTAGSFGESLNVVRRSTAQAGTTYSITLDASASSTDQAYRDMLIWVWTGGGSGQGGLISNYNGTTKVASLYATVPTSFSNTSVFQIVPSAAGTATPLTISSTGAVNINESQALTIPAAAGGTVGKALVNMNYATVYLDAAISSSSGMALSTTLNLTSPTDNTVGKVLARLYHATDYLNAAVSSRSAPATAQTIDQTTALSGATAGSIGQALLRMNHATVYLDAAVSSRGTYSGGAIVGNITGNLSGSVGSVTGAVGSVTTVSDKTGYRLSSTGVDDILATALTEGYAADGATMTLTQAVYMIFAMLAEKSISSTTMTVKKLNGSTTAMTFTLDSATSPTSITRAT